MRNLAIFIAAFVAVLSVGTSPAIAAPPSSTPPPSQEQGQGGIQSELRINDKPSAARSQARARVLEAAGVSSVPTVCSSRTIICSQVGFTVTQTKDKKVIGLFDVDVAIAVRMDVRNLQNTVFLYGKLTDRMPGMTIMGGTFDITPGAVETTASLNPAQKIIATVTLPIAPAAQTGEQQFSYFTRRWTQRETYSSSAFNVAAKLFPNPVAPATINFEKKDTGTQVRCDNAALIQGGTPGCINPDYIPTVYFPKSKYPYINPNIQNGQSTLNGVGATLSNPLHRVSDTEREANNQYACSPARIADLLPPKPTNMVEPSCDEYPFASSNEGGTTSVLAWVPLAENQSQGGTLSTFFNNNRVIYFPLARDAFLVSLNEAPVN